MLQPAGPVGFMTVLMPLAVKLLVVGRRYFFLVMSSKADVTCLMLSTNDTFQRSYRNCVSVGRRGFGPGWEQSSGKGRWAGS